MINSFFGTSKYYKYICTIREIMFKLDLIKSTLPVLTKEEISLVNNNSDFFKLIKEKEGDTIYNWSKYYLDLSYSDQDFIKSISNILTKDGRLDYLNSNYNNIDNIDVIIDNLLPKWYKINFKLFGIYNPSEFTSIDTYDPEYNKKENLAPDIYEIEKNIRDQIYSNFFIGEVITGPIIKERLSKIYIGSYYKRTPKVKDLNNFFDIKNTRKGYKLNLRK